MAYEGPSGPPTKSEFRSMRALADLGGVAWATELREHDDWRTHTHFIHLRERGYLESREGVKDGSPTHEQVWAFTEKGREAFEQEVEVWTDAYAALQESETTLEAETTPGVEL